jgi:hypothetical protein
MRATRKLLSNASNESPSRTRKVTFRGALEIFGVGFAVDAAGLVTVVSVEGSVVGLPARLVPGGASVDRDLVLDGTVIVVAAMCGATFEGLKDERIAWHPKAVAIVTMAAQTLTKLVSLVPVIRCHMARSGVLMRCPMEGFSGGFNTMAEIVTRDLRSR